MGETLRTKTGLEQDVMIAQVLCENITHFETTALEQELTAAGQQGRWKLAIDMTQVQLVGSAGLGLFISVNKSAKAGGGKMVLFGINQEIYNSMKVTRLTSLFTIVKDKKSAMGSF
jgi:anti-anti-sigma factor